MTAGERIKGRRIGVVGMAKSGLAAALLAERLGAQVFVSDMKPSTQLTEPIQALIQRRIKFETGGHTSKLLDSDYLVVSPGVPMAAPIIQSARQRGLPVFSEIEFASWLCPGEIYAITGSNGKTTTTTLIGAIFRAAGYETHVGGNIGLPLAEFVTDISDQGKVVLEVSTFQLEGTETFHPRVAAILNLSPDHLDRHGTYEAYKALKYRITENQQSEDKFILNAQDRDSTTDRPATKAQVCFFSAADDDRAMAFVRDGFLWLRQTGGDEERVIATDQIGIPGPHNLQNAAAAAAVAMLAKVPVEVLGRVLREFGGVEHRLERVDSVDGVTFVNDSKATNVDSVGYALRSVDSPIILIAGGRGKGASYQPLVEHGRGKVKLLVLIGEAGHEIEAELGPHFDCRHAETLRDAVQAGFEAASAGDTVLLSPACASFDMFESYEHRGRAFKAAVAGLKRGKTNSAQS